MSSSRTSAPPSLKTFPREAFDVPSLLPAFLQRQPQARQEHLLHRFELQEQQQLQLQQELQHQQDKFQLELQQRQLQFDQELQSLQQKQKQQQEDQEALKLPPRELLVVEQELRDDKGRVGHSVDVLALPPSSFSSWDASAVDQNPISTPPVSGLPFIADRGFNYIPYVGAATCVALAGVYAWRRRKPIRVVTMPVPTTVSEPVATSASAVATAPRSTTGTAFSKYRHPEKFVYTHAQRGIVVHAPKFGETSVDGFVFYFHPCSAFRSLMFRLTGRPVVFSGGARPYRLAGLKMADDPMTYARFAQLTHGKVAYLRAVGGAFRPNALQSDDPPPEDCVLWGSYRGAHLNMARCFNGRLVFEGLGRTSGAGVPGLDGLEQHYPRLVKRMRHWEFLARTFRVGMWAKEPQGVVSVIVLGLFDVFRLLLRGGVFVKNFFSGSRPSSSRSPAPKS